MYQMAFMAMLLEAASVFARSLEWVGCGIPNPVLQVGKYNASGDDFRFRLLYMGPKPAAPAADYI